MKKKKEEDWGRKQVVDSRSESKVCLGSESKMRLKLRLTSIETKDDEIHFISISEAKRNNILYTEMIIKKIVIGPEYFIYLCPPPSFPFPCHEIHKPDAVSLTQSTRTLATMFTSYLFDPLEVTTLITSPENLDQWITRPTSGGPPYLFMPPTISGMADFNSRRRAFMRPTSHEIFLSVISGAPDNAALFANKRGSGRKEIHDNTAPPGPRAPPALKRPARPDRRPGKTLG
ncbi:hypothetical protein EVAR_11704_1 [Eumeta japonica]|uniref:Uncharacterized protein n=1 Tax=Eumeta variegata TaxID=151549 RepID=A0A4C1U4T5_EUMVA|nr:hypothetical protein EVAR_11704_1 [Eumeta japonica]